MEAINFAGVAAVPLIVALVAMLRGTFKMDARFAALAAVLIGVALNVGYAYQTGAPVNLYIAIVTGLTLGLSASGLYSGAKAALEDNSPPVIREI
jgi:hypothetical protein